MEYPSNNNRSSNGTDAIALKVKHEFIAKEKEQAAKKMNTKAQPKPVKKTAVA